ncbi:hypothetical protein [Actinoplanes sp. DH11]|uniref:hypothetical protein n=1 Tax=Actinoplanes sp. DH11 TaxID=2857011 RepID=UPI001E64B2FB|nr:hypothetical protein [Actinoplanes sp. DH11]
MFENYHRSQQRANPGAVTFRWQSAIFFRVARHLPARFCANMPGTASAKSSMSSLVTMAGPAC